MFQINVSEVMIKTGICSPLSQVRGLLSIIAKSNCNTKVYSLLKCQRALHFKIYFQ